MSEYEIVVRIPTVGEYNSLREAVGWRKIPDHLAKLGLRNALFCVCALQDSTVVGCGRVIGDGAICFYIQDMIVHPEHQGRKVGAGIMDAIMQYLRSLAEGAYIALMAAEGVERFYERYGFRRRPDNRPGMDMLVGKKGV